MNVRAEPPVCDTIFALASGAGQCAIAVIRLSGPRAAHILVGLCGALPAPRIASLRRLCDEAGALLDHGLVLWFPGPASYSGEDVAELHLHGGRAVLEVVTEALGRAGARPAERGEFTRRAVAAGKMDVLTAEAVADLVDAETDLQRAHALRQMSGTQRDQITTWMAELTRFLAWQEALIDFPEEDLPPEVEEDLVMGIARLLAEMRQMQQAGVRGERLRRGLVFAIVGAPNVGKSSLLNTLAGYDAAIVTCHPGTTRDAVRVDIVLDGIPVTLVDTAGLRETSDEIEAEGVRRARAHAAEADFVVQVFDATIPELATIDDLSNERTMTVANKIDLAPAPTGVLGLSAHTGVGIAMLLCRLAETAVTLADPGKHPALTRARHLAALRDAELGLDAALEHDNAELRAEELRQARSALGRILGLESDAVLDEVFSGFCIGK